MKSYGSKEVGGVKEHYPRLYQIYNTMKKRCYNKNSSRYKYYGARGITICEEWLKSYDAFGQWASQNGYQDDLTLDRINNNGNYCPENCRWVSMKEQCSNRRSHEVTWTKKKINIFNLDHVLIKKCESILEASIFLKTSYSSAQHHLYRKTPIKKQYYIEYNILKEDN